MKWFGHRYSGWYGFVVGKQELEGADRFWGEIKKVCQIMKLTVDIGHFWWYISWAVGNNCFLDRDNSNRFLKRKRN